MATVPLPTPLRPSSQRSPLALAALALFVVFQGAALYSAGDAFGAPSVGLHFRTHGCGRAVAFPVTEGASKAVEGLADPLHVVEVNGSPWPAVADPFAAALRNRLRGALGVENRLRIRDDRGHERRVALVTAPLGFREFVTRVPEALAYGFVGWVYALFGILVWWKRPDDLAAQPLLLFSLLAGVHMSFNPLHDAFAHQLAMVGKVLSPFYAPFLLHLGLRFTGFHRHGAARFLLAGLAAAAVLLSLLNATTFFLVTNDRVQAGLRAAWLCLLLLALFGVVFVSFRAARPPYPLGLRRRARVLGAAALLSFTLPSVAIALPAEFVHWSVLCTALLLFPSLMAYATVRLGAFDIRLVIGQGLLYVSLSVSVLLGYLALAYFGVRFLGQGGERTVWVGIAMAGFVVMLSLGQLRVQAAINRLVFRGLYVYADALAAASDHLARSRRHDEIFATARAALMDAMQLSRAAIAVMGERGQLRCHTLGSLPDSFSGEQPAALPNVLDPALLAPVGRALADQQLASAHDSQVTMQQAHEEAAGNPYDEAGFWPHFGIEWIVPVRLGRRDGPGRVRGLLLLGPKRNGRAFDTEDRKLIVTLANQLAVALDNATAFEEIERLKEGLEEQVARRTQELSRAMADLERTHGQLVESAKQAMLGRLMAGIVHEVNSPLGALQSTADTAARLLDRVQAYVTRAAMAGDGDAARLLPAAETAPQLRTVLVGSSERIAGLMGSLKRFASVDEAVVREFDVREGIDSALTLLAPSLGDGIRVCKRYECDEPLVECRPARLNQVFLNVIENAAQAIEARGEIDIHVQRERGSVQIRVRDTGRGMDAETVAQLFEYGFSNKAGRVSMRLGLPSNKATVEELGGDILVTSRRGEGTLVTVSLPACVPLAQAAPSRGVAPL